MLSYEKSNISKDRTEAAPWFGYIIHYEGTARYDLSMRAISTDSAQANTKFGVLIYP